MAFRRKARLFLLPISTGRSNHFFELFSASFSLTSPIISLWNSKHFCCRSRMIPPLTKVLSRPRSARNRGKYNTNNPAISYLSVYAKFSCFWSASSRHFMLWQIITLLYEAPPFVTGFILAPVTAQGLLLASSENIWSHTTLISHTNIPYGFQKNICQNPAYHNKRDFGRIGFIFSCRKGYTRGWNILPARDRALGWIGTHSALRLAPEW